MKAKYPKLIALLLCFAILSSCGDEGKEQLSLPGGGLNELAIKIEDEISTFSPLSNGETYNVPLIDDLRTSPLAEKVLNSTVYIVADRDEGPAQGTGFVCGPELIATAYHVVQSSGTVQLQFQAMGSDVYYTRATIAALDATRDLIIYRVEGYNSPPLSLADSDEVYVGQKIFVTGNPRGLKGTFSSGIISAVRENVFQGSERGKQIQITAPVSAGNSGSPVVNERGEVIGMATTMVDEVNDVTFIAPSNYLKTLLHGQISSEVPEPPTIAPAGIVPGISISGIRVGMTTAQVRQAIGEPNSEREFLEQPYLSYSSLGLGVVTKNDQVVLLVARSANTAKTAGEHGIGSTRTSIESEFGSAESISNAHYYWSIGIAFAYDANLRANIIMVFDTDELRALL